MRMNPNRRLLRAALVGGFCLCGIPSLATAQRGGRTNKGIESDKPVETMANTLGRRVRGDLDDRDPLDFLLKREKQLALTGAQKDSIKALQKEADNAQKPIYKEFQKILAEAERDAMAAAGGGALRGMPPLARDLVGRMNEVQDQYGTRARAQLDARQLHLADSLQVVYAAELRDKAEKQRGGRGGN